MGDFAVGALRAGANMEKKGSILILSVWFLTTLSLLVSSLTFRIESHLQVVKKETESFFNRSLFISGLNLAMSVMESDPEPYNDSPLDDWFGAISLDQPWAGKVSIHVEDENAKLNLNRMSRAMILAFFEWVGRKDLAKTILKWQEKNGRPFASLEELLTLEDMTPKIYGEIQPYLTVYGDHALPQVNINTVSLPLLQVILKSIPGSDFDKKRLSERIRESREAKDPQYFTFEELSPHFFLSKLQLGENIQMVSLINQLLPYLTTDSVLFEIDLTTVENKAHAQAIIQYRQDSLQPFEVLSWHEE